MRHLVIAQRVSLGPTKEGDHRAVRLSESVIPVKLRDPNQQMEQTGLMLHDHRVSHAGCCAVVLQRIFFSVLSSGVSGRCRVVIGGAVVLLSFYSARLVVYSWQVQDDVVRACVEVPFQPAVVDNGFISCFVVPSSLGLFLLI